MLQYNGNGVRKVEAAAGYLATFLLLFRTVQQPNHIQRIFFRQPIGAYLAHMYVALHNDRQHSLVLS